MRVHAKQLELIARLEENERLIARLYSAYAEHFEEYRAFWSDLAEEEKKHASMLLNLLHQVREGALRLRDDRFDETSIQMQCDYVKALVSKARTETLSLEDALGQALAIEHDLRERHFFRVFEGDSPELALILDALESSTNEHRKRLLEEIENVQKS
jgi:rubrerythrin